MSGLPFQVVPYDAANPAHVAFVRDAVRRRAQDWPYGAADVPWLLEQVDRAAKVNARGCVLAVADDDADLFYGCALTDAGEVVFAMTKAALRGPGAFDAPVGTKRAHPGVCTTLLAAVGVRLDRPTPVRIWSTAATKIAARGYPIYPSIPK